MCVCFWKQIFKHIS